MNHALFMLGLAVLCGCSNATPAISNLSIPSPVTVSTSGVFVLSGSLQVSDAAGDSALSLDLTMSTATGQPSTFTAPLTPGGDTAMTDEVLSFDVQLSPAWTKGTYAVRAAVTDGNDGHTSNALETTVVLQ